MKKTIGLILLVLNIPVDVFPKSEVYRRAGFVEKGISSEMSKNASVVRIEIVRFVYDKFNKLEVKLTDIIWSNDSIPKYFIVNDDPFDPVFRKELEVGSQWIIRIYTTWKDSNFHCNIDCHYEWLLAFKNEKVSGYIDEKISEIIYVDFKTLFIGNLKMAYLENMPEKYRLIKHRFDIIGNNEILPSSFK